MPYRVSDEGALLALQSWASLHGKKIEGFLLICEVIFFNQEEMEETIKFFHKKNFSLIEGCEYIDDKGNVFKLVYDKESEELINSIRKND